MVGQGVHPRDKEKHMAARTVRRRRSVLIAAAVLALPIAGITPATAADKIAPVSGTLAQLLSAVAGGTQLTALVHATDAAAFRKFIDDEGVRWKPVIERAGLMEK